MTRRKMEWNGVNGGNGVDGVNGVNGVNGREGEEKKEEWRAKDRKSRVPISGHTAP